MPQISALKDDEKVSRDDPRLFNMNDLATILGVNRGYIRRMKFAGFKMPGGRATVDMALTFIEGNPDLLPAVKETAHASPQPAHA
jgi:hypothetical protein